MLTAGLSLKPEYYDDALSSRASAAEGLWFEVHPENYMVAGGPRLQWLQRIRGEHPLSLHGVGLSMGGVAPLDEGHLKALRRLVTRFEPALVSEHLAWSVHDGRYFPDLLPFLRTQDALQRVAERIDRMQTVLGRRVAIENPTHYLNIAGHSFSETDFLRELVLRTGCALLLDLNNVWISARNLGTDPAAYLADYPLASVAEIHLAGFTADPQLGDALLIDSHDQPVSEAVWALYRQVLAVTGPIPTLIERDGNLPAFDELLAERDRAHGNLHEAAAAVGRCSHLAEAETQAETLTC